MAGFNFDQAEQFVQESDNKINFLKLQDDGWYAKVRFMYGPGEVFRGETVHNVSEDPKKPKYVPCLREAGQPLESCPLCAKGAKIMAQFFIPVYVISIVSNIRGAEQEQPIGQVMLFQRGTTFSGPIKSVVRQAQAQNKPIVSCVFNLVRNGKAGDQKTNYSVELIGVDDTTLEQLPPRPEILGSYILPKVDYQTMVEKYINKTEQAVQTTKPADIQPRTLNANTFAGNTVGFGQTTTVQQTAPAFNQPMNNTNQAPVQAPTIGNGSSIGNNGVPF